jgi:hypothetical protein
MTENLESFLKETEFCDYSHPAITKIAEKYKEKYKDQKELAKALFYFVRDDTYYQVGFWNKKASETLAEEAGNCTNNANLLVALLRKVGIPAGYGVMKVKGREYLGPIVPPRLKKFIGKRSTHVYAYAFINGRWLKCDPSSDEPFAYNTQHFNPQSILVEWDGENHGTTNIYHEHIISDQGPEADIDHLINRKLKWYKVIPTKIANLYIIFLRETGRQYNDQFSAENAFSRWLSSKHPFYFLCYSAIGLIN